MLQHWEMFTEMSKLNYSLNQLEKLEAARSAYLCLSMVTFALVTFGYHWLPLVTIGYHWLPLVTFDYLWSSFLTLLSLSRLAFLGLTRPY